MSELSDAEFEELASGLRHALRYLATLEVESASVEAVPAATRDRDLSPPVVRNIPSEELPLLPMPFGADLPQREDTPLELAPENPEEAEQTSDTDTISVEAEELQHERELSTIALDEIHLWLVELADRLHAVGARARQPVDLLQNT